MHLGSLVPAALENAYEEHFQRHSLHNYRRLLGDGLPICGSLSYYDRIGFGDGRLLTAVIN